MIVNKNDTRTKEELAESIRNNIAQLNTSLGQAAVKGLKVDLDFIDMGDYTTMSSYGAYEHQQLKAEIYERL